MRCFRHAFISRKLAPIMAQRILHVVESSTPEAGTVAVLLDGLHVALRERGVESNAVALNGSTGEHKFAELVAETDLVHFHGWGHRSARDLAGEARRSGKPYVISPFGSLTYGPYRRRTWSDRLARPFRDGPVVRRAAALSAPSNNEADKLRKNRTHSNVHVLPYGVTSAEYAAHGDSQSEPNGSGDTRLMLLLGPIDPREGFLPLLRSLEELGAFADGWNLIVAGRKIADWPSSVEPWIASKGWTDRIRFCEAPNVAAQRKLLAEASLVVAPSLHTRCPVSIIQAAAAGVPVIASACTVPSELEDAVCVFGTARVELKIDLRKMLAMTDDELAAMADRAQEAVRTRIEWTTVVEQYTRFYESLV